MQKLSIITLNESNITDFASARNKELDGADSEWVLFVDSDEKITASLKAEVLEAIESKEYVAYYIKRLDTFLGVSASW
jgi:hypothetical protein